MNRRGQKVLFRDALLRLCMLCNYILMESMHADDGISGKHTDHEIDTAI